MTSFSANLGFLWTDLPLPDAIAAAANAGFSAVECHYPYDVPAADVRAALEIIGLPMLGLNTRRGDVGAGDNGLAAIPGREDEARAAITEAVIYASEIKAQNVHVMAGLAKGSDAHSVFLESLTFALDLADQHNLTILIEPLNSHDAPGYFLNRVDQALEILKQIDHPRLKLMFDCYHVARTEGAVMATFDQAKPWVGHIQFAGVPNRGEPDAGTVDYQEIFSQLRAHGWLKPLGAEYRPSGATDQSLGWMLSLV